MGLFSSITMVARVLVSLMSKVSSLFLILCGKLTRLRTWGNSLSYASAGGTTGSASPQTLADTTIGDNVEIVIMTDKPCSSGDCGTVRPGTVAYRKSIYTHDPSLGCNCPLNSSYRWLRWAHQDVPRRVLHATEWKDRLQCRHARHLDAQRSDTKHASVRRSYVLMLAVWLW
jgi:hypothetical protein